MKEPMNRKEKIITISYILALLGMLSIVVLVFVSRQKPVQTKSEETYQNITASWTLDKEGTQPVDVKKLGEYMDEETGVLSMYYQLPKMSSDVGLVYRSKDVYTRVLVDGVTIYGTSVYESEFYNRSPGNLWNIVNINSKYSGKCLEIRIEMVYDTDAITVDSLLIGDKADIILGLFGDNIFGVVISLLLVLLGAVLIVVDCLPSYGRARKHHGLFWVGIYALLSGIWCLIETNLVQFCIDDMRILQLLDNMIMMLTTVPLILYINTEYKILQNRLVRILSYLSIAYIFLSVFEQYRGVKDFHDMLNNGLYLMVISDFVLCTWTFCKIFKLKKAKQSILNCVLMFIGLTSCCSLTIFETIRSLQVDRMDRAGLIRIGMLIQCIFLGIGAQIESYKVVERGLRYDLVSKLAYSDGLTGLGNRTAYLEQLEAYGNKLKEIMRLGIVYLDVNNLKIINDNQGHEFGDELIRLAAKIIEESFGSLGKAYRIGGDEFCVLMTGDDLQEKYEKGLAIFQQLINEANKGDLFMCDIQIAHGFAVCEEMTKEKIEETVATADGLMYQNKTELKEKDSRLVNYNRGLGA